VCGRTFHGTQCRRAHCRGKHGFAEYGTDSGFDANADTDDRARDGGADYRGSHGRANTRSDRVVHLRALTCVPRESGSGGRADNTGRELLDHGHVCERTQLSRRPHHEDG
jgi:hypothetical protein